MDRIKGWETKAMRHLLRCKKKRGCDVERVLHEDGEGSKSQKSQPRACGWRWVGLVTQGQMRC